MSQAGKTQSESKAQTRYSEADSFEVLLLRSISYDPEQQAGILVLLNGEQVRLPLNRSALTRADWRERTKRLTQEIVQVRPSESPLEISRERLQKFGLHHCFYLGNPMWQDDESLLRLALVDETEQLRGLENQQVHDRYDIEYRPDLGYWTVKK